MKQLTLLNWIVLGVGEAIIILAFLLLAQNLPTDIFCLDLIISMFVFALGFSRIIRPMINLGDRAQRETGSIGLTFTATGIYTLIAILAMIAMQYAGLEFKYQILIQIILGFMLLVAFMTSTRINTKTVEVFNHEQELQDTLLASRDALRSLSGRAAISADIAPALRSRIDTLTETARYISPANTHRARELENEMLTQTQYLASLLSDPEANAEMIERTIRILENTCSERKNCYSN